MTKTYEELLKLDAERTQGEWQFKSGLFQYGENHPKDTYDAVLCENASPYEEIASNEPYYPVRVETQDLRFIAAAPEINNE